MIEMDLGYNIPGIKSMPWEFSKKLKIKAIII